METIKKPTSIGPAYKTSAAQHLPTGLTEEEYFELAILCLDQAGLSARSQVNIADAVREEIGL